VATHFDEISNQSRCSDFHNVCKLSAASGRAGLTCPNSKEEVDAGLLNWSRRGPSALKTYNNILAQTIAAENALAQYYQRDFKMSAGEAKTTAATVLETGRRTYFVFHKGH
jgi:hypothetical protein